MTTSAPDVEVDVEAADFKPLTADEAQRLRASHPALSPWWVVAAQVAVGLLLSVLAWLWVREWSAAVSVLYGALAIALPAALFARGTRGTLNAPAAMLRFAVWELIKVLLSVAMLAAAPLLIGDLHWLALLAGVVAAMKMYWVALVVRPRFLNWN